MQRTVLELVQGILTETSGDEINSIEDTIEAGDIASIMAQVYSEMVDEFSLPSTKTIQALTGLGDPALPNFMQLPDDAYNIEFIKYDCRLESDDDKNYRDINYLDPNSFVNLVNGNPSTDTTNYQVVQWDSNVPLIIHKLKAPSFWTTFDDNYIVFDSWDSNVDSTLQSSKSIIYSETRPQFFIEDEFTPELPENLENVLYIRTLNRTLATDTKINPVTTVRERRSDVRTMRNKWKAKRQTYFDPNFGRR
jgi:hypothetical protein